MKKCMKRFYSVLLCLCLVFTLLPAGEIQAAGKVTLNYTTLTVSKGNTRTLIVSGTSKKITWTSSNKKVASVSSNGVVTGVKKGKATITAKYGNKKLTCKVTVLGLDPEVQRGITLGLVSKDYLGKASALATTKEAEDLFAKILKKKGASAAKIKKWNKLAQGAKAYTTYGDVAMGIYYCASYLAEDGIPQTNAADYGDWWPKDWEDSDYRLVPAVNDPKHPSKYYNYDAFHGFDPLVENQYNNVVAVGYALQLASHYSGQFVIPRDFDRDGYYINEEITRAQLVLSLVRFYDSFESDHHYLSIASLDNQCPISQKEIKSAKKVPEVDENGQSSEWIGTFTQNYGCIGQNGAWSIHDDPTWNFREGDFKAMADLGINYVRIQFSINSFAYPDYSEDRTKVNRELVEELDDVVRWGLKYGLHVSICFQGYLDDDLDGLGAMTPDGAKENEFTPDMLASKESYALKGKLLAGFAGRYKNVPAKNLSFELQNENDLEAQPVDGVQMMTSDQMAEQFIMLARSVWNVTPERGVSLSTTGFKLTEKYRKYWSKLAEAGINMDYHCYEPGSFVAPSEWGHVDASKMKWPGFTDNDGITWDMEKVYQTYVAPWKELADEYHVGFKLGECGIFVAGDLFTTTPYRQKDVVAWAKDFATVMQKHQVSYAIGKFAGETLVTTIIRDALPSPELNQIYIKNAVYTKKTYRLEEYTLTVYVNEALAKAAFGKKK